MNVNKFLVLKTDASGKNPENRIVKEPIVPEQMTGNAFSPLYAPFFEEGLEITESLVDGSSKKLVLDTDYELITMFGMGSRISVPMANNDPRRKRLYYGIRLKTALGSRKIDVSYQSVGNMPWHDKNDYDRMMSSYMDFNNLYADLKTIGLKKTVDPAILAKLEAGARFVDAVDPNNFKNPVYWQELPIDHKFFWMTIGELVKPKPTAKVATPALTSPIDGTPVDVGTGVPLVFTPFTLIPILVPGSDAADLAPDTIKQADIELWDYPKQRPDGTTDAATLLFSTQLTSFAGETITVTVPAILLQNNQWRDFTVKARYTSHIYGVSEWGINRIQTKPPAIVPKIMKPTVLSFINEGNGSNLVATKLQTNVPDTLASMDWEVYADQPLTMMKASYPQVKKTNYLVSALGVRLHDEIPQAFGGLTIKSWSFISDTEMILCGQVAGTDHSIVAKIEFDEPRATYPEFADLRSQKVVWEYSVAGGKSGAGQVFQYAKLGTDGFVYAVGNTVKVTPLDFGRALVENKLSIVKMSESGAVVWAKAYTFPGGLTTEGKSFFTDGFEIKPDGSLCIFGTCRDGRDEAPISWINVMTVGNDGAVISSINVNLNLAVNNSPLVCSVNSSGYACVATAVTNAAFNGNDILVIRTNGDINKTDVALLQSSEGIKPLHNVTCVTADAGVGKTGFTLGYVGVGTLGKSVMKLVKFDQNFVAKKTLGLDSYGHIYNFKGDLETSFEVIGSYGENAARETTAFALKASFTNNAWKVDDQKGFTYVPNAMTEFNRTAATVSSRNGDNWIVGGPMLSRMYRNAPADLESLFSQAEDAAVLTSANGLSASVSLSAYNVTLNVVTTADTFANIGSPNVITNPGTIAVSSDDDLSVPFASSVVAVDYDVRGFESGANDVPGIRVGKKGFTEDKLYARVRYNSAKGLQSEWSDAMPFTLNGTKLYQDYSEVTIQYPTADVYVQNEPDTVFRAIVSRKIETGPIGSRNKQVLTSSVWEVSDVTVPGNSLRHAVATVSAGDLTVLNLSSIKPLAIGRKYSLRVYFNGYLTDANNNKLYPITVGGTASGVFNGPQPVAQKVMKTPTIIEPHYGQIKGANLRVRTDAMAMLSGTDTLETVDYQVTLPDGTPVISNYAVRANKTVAGSISVAYEQVPGLTGNIAGNTNIVDMATLPDGFVAIVESKELSGIAPISDYAFSRSIVRFDDKGDPIWRTSLPAKYYPQKIATSATGEVYVAMTVTDIPDVVIAKMDNVSRFIYPTPITGKVLSTNRIYATRGFGMTEVHELKVAANGNVLISGKSIGTTNFGFIANISGAATSIVEFAESINGAAKLDYVSFTEQTDGIAYAVTAKSQSTATSQFYVGFIPKAAPTVKWQKSLKVAGLNDTSVLRVAGTPGSNYAMLYLTKSDKNFVGFMDGINATVVAFELDVSTSGVPATINDAAFSNLRGYLGLTVNYERKPELNRKNEALVIAINATGQILYQYQYGVNAGCELVSADAGSLLYLATNSPSESKSAYLLKSYDRATGNFDDMAIVTNYASGTAAGVTLGAPELAELGGQDVGALSFSSANISMVTAKPPAITTSVSNYVKPVANYSDVVKTDIATKLLPGNYVISCKYNGKTVSSDWSTGIPFQVYGKDAATPVPVTTISYPTGNPSLDIKADNPMEFLATKVDLKSYVGIKGLVWTFYKEQVSVANRLTVIKTPGLTLKVSDLVGTPADLGNTQLMVTVAVEAMGGIVGGESVPTQFTKNTVVPVTMEPATFLIPANNATGIELKPSIWVKNPVFISGTGVLDHTEWSFYEDGNDSNPAFFDMNHTNNGEPTAFDVQSELKPNTKYNVFVVFVTVKGDKSPRTLTGSFTTSAAPTDKIATPTVTGGGTISTQGGTVDVIFSDYAVESGTPPMLGYTVKVTDVTDIASPKIVSQKTESGSTNPGTKQYGFSDFGYNGRFMISFQYNSSAVSSLESTTVAYVTVSLSAVIVKKPIVTEPDSTVTVTPTIVASPLEVLNASDALKSATWEVWLLPNQPPFDDVLAFTKTIQSASADPTKLLITTPLLYNRQYKIRVSYQTYNNGDSPMSEFAMINTETKTFTGKSGIEMPYVLDPYQFATLFTNVPGQDKINLSGFNGYNNLLSQGDLTVSFINPDTNSVEAVLNDILTAPLAVMPQAIKNGVCRFKTQVDATGLSSGLSEMLQVFVGSKNNATGKPAIASDSWGRPATTVDTLYGIAPEATSIGAAGISTSEWRVTDGNNTWTYTGYQGVTFLGKSYGPTEIPLFHLLKGCNQQAPANADVLWFRASIYQYSVRYKGESGTPTDWSDWLSVSTNYASEMAPSIIRANYHRQFYTDSEVRVYGGVGNTRSGTAGKMAGDVSYKIIKVADGSEVKPYTPLVNNGLSDVTPVSTLTGNDLSTLADGETYELWFLTSYPNGFSAEAKYGKFVYRNVPMPADGSGKMATKIDKPIFGSYSGTILNRPSSGVRAALSPFQSHGLPDTYAGFDVEIYNGQNVKVNSLSDPSGPWVSGVYLSGQDFGVSGVYKLRVRYNTTKTKGEWSELSTAITYTA